MYLRLVMVMTLSLSDATSSCLPNGNKTGWVKILMAHGMTWKNITTPCDFVEISQATMGKNPMAD
jgi:hypothetical protein